MIFSSKNLLVCLFMISDIQRFFGHTITCKTSGFKEAVAHALLPYENVSL